jgi:hypothetical protein
LTIDITSILHFYEEFLLQKSWRAFEKVSAGIKMPAGTRLGTTEIEGKMTTVRLNNRDREKEALLNRRRIDTETMKGTYR